ETREGFSYTNTAAITADDLAGIGAWLEEECRRLGWDCQPLRDREDMGDYKWQLAGKVLAGCPENWRVEVLYQARAAGIVMVFAYAIRGGATSEKETQRVLDLAQRHALQAYGRQSGGSAGLRSSVGVRQYLATLPLPAGLLESVVTRLLAAMREVDPVA